MKIKTQCTATVILFTFILAIVGGSFIATLRQTEHLQRQKDLAHALELGARELSYLSNDFLLHGESQQRFRWEKRFSELSRLLEGFSPDQPELANVVREIGINRTRLESVFAEVASIRERGSLDREAMIDMIRISWSRMEVQNQGIAFNASQIVALMEEQAYRLQQRRIILLFALISIFGTFLLINFVTVNRRMLRSLATLQEKAAIIGSGNLEIKLEERRADEIGDLSRAFNRMTADLKAVTASKADLEREILERRKVEEALKESEAKYRNLFMNMTEEVHFWQVFRHEDGTIETWRLVDVNPPALRSWGRKTAEEIRGKTTDEIFGPGATEHYLPIVRKIMDEGVSHSFEDYFPLLDKHFRFTSVPLGDHFITTGADITAIKKAEEELRRSNRELQQFAYAASHDLQEPLRAIVGFLQLLRDKCGDRLDERGRHYIERSVKAGFRMQEMIQGLLNLSRVGNRGEKFVSVDLNQVVRNIRDDLQRIIQEKNGDIVCAELPNLDADAGQMQSLFRNLILNGLKYNVDPRPTVEIGCVVEERLCRFSVRDNGIGISPKFHERIFLVFQRLHTEREYSGSGMGLALCKKIVERHGGTIWVESQKNEGATFYFTLPKGQVSGPSAVGGETTPRVGHQPA